MERETLRTWPRLLSGGEEEDTPTELRPQEEGGHGEGSFYLDPNRSYKGSLKPSRGLHG